MFEELFNFIEGPARWLFATIALVALIFLSARRKTSRSKLFELTTKTSNIIIDWEKKPGGQIPVELWMKSPEVKAVLAAITINGKEARFIGGCVRDAILKRPVNDIDIATQETPDKVIALLDGAGIKAIPIGIEHGTVMAVVNHQSFEITTLRKDVKTDGRHAVVKFTENWKQDASRRDFTFNTLSATPDGMVFDYFNGIQDLSNRVIRFVGHAPERIEEDYLRILRYFRFIATIGMRVESKTEFQACIDQAYKLKQLSGERIRAELFKILNSDMPLDILALMYEQGVLQIIVPHVIAPEKLRQLNWLETSAMKFESISRDPLRRLAALVQTDKTGVTDITDALRLSKIEQKRLSKMLVPSFDVKWDMNENELHAILYVEGAEAVIDLVLLKWADMLVSSPTGLTKEKNGWLHIIRMAIRQQGNKAIFPLKGQDVLFLDVAPGPEVSRLLERVKFWWLEGGCKADRGACLKKLKSFQEI